MLVARLGTAPAFFLNAAGSLLVALALARLSHEGRPAPGAQGSVGAAMLRGLRYVRATPRLVFVLALLTTVTLTVFNFAVYVPLLARDVLGLGPRGFGLLMACLGIGGLFPVGALWVGGAAEAWGVSVTLGLAGVAGLLGVGALVAWWALRAPGTAAERWR